MTPLVYNTDLFLSMPMTKLFILSFSTDIYTIFIEAA